MARFLRLSPSYWRTDIRQTVGERKGELANFVVMFDEEKSKLKVPAELQKSPEATHVLEINKGLFVPK